MKKEKEGNVEDLKKEITEQENLKMFYDSVVLKKKKIQEQITKISKEILEMETKHTSTWVTQRSEELITVDISRKEEELNKRLGDR